MAPVVMPTDQNENKKQGCDPTKQEDKKAAPEAQTRGEDPPKTISRWTKARNYLLGKPKGKIKSSKPNCKSEESRATTDATQPDPLIEFIESSMDHISKHAEDLEPHTKTSKFITDHLDRLKQFYKTIDVKDPGEKRKMLENLKMDLIKLNLAVPSKNKAGADKKDPLENLKFITIEAEQQRTFDAVSVNMPQLHNNPIFDTSMELKEFVAHYNKLEDRLKLCLLCFSIFPADAIIKKRLMVQWWVVEGYALSEEVADSYFKLLLEKGFVEPVNPNRSLSVGSCRIHPFNRWALVALAERANFFNFTGGGHPTQNFSECFQACLMGRGLISYEDFIKKKNESGKEGHTDAVIKGVIDDLEKLHLVMNVDEHILELKHEWVGKMRNVNVLYLGRWKASSTHHIEVDDVEFLVKGLESMRCVKLLSLQGVSNIISLPDSILNLTNVNVLDLRACYNLESIPKDTGRYLDSLTHLDMSECYLLNHMPKSLSMLTLLKVLKGFFVDGAPNKDKSHCTLADLQKLHNLEKLCIYTNSKDFPENQDVVDLEKLKKLRKLTITWGVHEVSAKKNLNEPKLEPETATKAGADAKAEVEVEAGAEAKAEVEAGAEAEAKVDAGAEAGAGAEAEAKAKAETGAKTKVEAGTEAKTKAEAEAEAETEIKANATAGAVAKAKTEAGAVAKPKAEAKEKADAKEKAGKLPASLEKLDLKCFPMSKTKAEAEAEAEAELKANAKAGAVAKAKTEAGAVAKEKADAKEKAGKLPASLEKLDLKCFPKSKTPDWLKLQNLEQLKKLYVRGGKFCDVGQYEGRDKVWKVEVLRLKYLAEIDMEWMRLQELFPKLKYLEQVSCPKLTFVPCDAKGVWINPE